MLRSWSLLALVGCAAEGPSEPRASSARLSSTSLPGFLELDAEIEGSIASGKLGWALAVGDTNGDGYDDLAIGSPDLDAVHVHLGSAYGVATTASWESLAAIVPASYGESVAMGDLNGDGYDDLLVTAPEWDGALSSQGAVFAYFGSADGPSATADWTIEGGVLGGDFGGQVAIGDVNADGYGDALIGTSGWNATGTLGGRVQVHYGSTAGPSVTPDWTVDGTQLAQGLGTRVAAADVNGDGVDDVVASSPSATSGTKAVCGLVEVWFGSATGPSATSSSSTYGVRSFQRLGEGLSEVGDVDGDGFDDLLIGDADNGAVILRGTASGLELPPWWYQVGDFGSFFGSVAVGSDFDRDGHQDVVISAWGETNGELWEGKLDLFFGSAAGLDATESWSAESNQAEAEVGLAMAVGDLDGDGAVDLVTSAPYYDTATATDAGVVWVLGGGCLDRAADTDADGIGDACDVCPSGDNLTDSDADGIADACDLCPELAGDAQIDTDGDGAGDACDLCPLAPNGDLDADGVCPPDDCDDENPLVFPGAPEVCDGADNSCDGVVPPEEVDSDLDGSLDCADCGPADPDVFPGAPERCNGVADACGDLPADELDGDSDGFLDCADCGPADPDVFPGAPERCNGVADACGDLPADELDGDSDGFLDCGDCDPSDPEVFPGASERCNGVDDDCDGVVDQGCKDDAQPEPSSGCGCEAGRADAAATVLFAVALTTRRRRGAIRASVERR